MSSDPGLRYPKAKALIDLIFFDAGGGHRASARALKAVIEQQGRPWQIRMINLSDVLEPIDFLHRASGLRAEDWYNGLLKHGLTIGSGPLLRLLHLVISRTHKRQTVLFARHWRDQRPDLVVSLVPHFNRAIFEALAGEIPMVTILTDLADYPPHFWIERQEQCLICGTAKAAQQALTAGYRPEQVFRTSGMIVQPDFYKPAEISPDSERRRIGLRPDLPTGLVMFGGFGSHSMLTIARRVAQAGLRTQLIFLCGRNEQLRQQLATMELPFPCRVEGFTREVAYFMRLADFFIGKPGPGSISEALMMKLPVIVERNSRTMVQERFNTEWIARNQFGIVLSSFTEIARGIASMLDRAQLARFRTRISSLNNRAVFEIPDILDSLIAAGKRPVAIAS